jgi:hypothetical protein
MEKKVLLIQQPTHPKPETYFKNQPEKCPHTHKTKPTTTKK